MTRKVTKRRLPNTSTMSLQHPPIDLGGGASAGRGGSLKNSSVHTASSRQVSEDITST